MSENSTHPRQGFTKIADIPPGHMPLLGQWGVIGYVKVVKGDWFEDDRTHHLTQTGNLVIISNPEHRVRYAELTGDGVTISVLLTATESRRARMERRLLGRISSCCKAPLRLYADTEMIACAACNKPESRYCECYRRAATVLDTIYDHLSKDERCTRCDKRISPPKGE